LEHFSSLGYRFENLSNLTVENEERFQQIA